MLLEASRQHKMAIRNTSDHQASKATMPGRCKHCNRKHTSDQCWPKFPHLAPEWYQIKLKYDKEQRKKEQQEQAKTARADDFEDYTGTHISC